MSQNMFPKQLELFHSVLSNFLLQIINDFQNIFDWIDYIHIVINCFLLNTFLSFQHQNMCNTQQQKQQNSSFDFWFALLHEALWRNNNTLTLQHVATRKVTLKVNIPAFTANVEVYQTTITIQTIFMTLIFGLFHWM